MMTRPLMLFATTLVGLGVAGAAHAIDGAIEINQTCAISTGCTSGDTPGFPVNIGAPGKYVLTSDLSHDPGQHGSVAILSVGSSDVTIDLNGFTIRSTSTCDTQSCPAGAVQGITALGRERLYVHGGRVVGVDANCIAAGNETRVEDVQLSDCALIGVFAGTNSLVRTSSIVSTGRNGIAGGLGTIYEGCTFAQNGLRNDTFLPDLTSSASMRARATGPNFCDDDLCGDGRTRFYLTTTTVLGDAALGACDVGFHMASVWELWDPSGVLYDTRRGETSPDAGAGPVQRVQRGWIRTGDLNSSANSPGIANCEVWSVTSGSGSSATLVSDWTAGHTWVPVAAPCNFPQRVWCIED